MRGRLGRLGKRAKLLFEFSRPKNQFALVEGKKAMGGEEFKKEWDRLAPIGKRNMDRMARRNIADRWEVPELIGLLERAKKEGLPTDGVPITECKKRLFKNLADDEIRRLGAHNFEIRIRGGQAFLAPKKRRRRKIIMLTRK